MKRIRWLITGGCGFIGTALISKLVPEEDHYIRVLDNLSVGTREDLGRVCDFIEIVREMVKSEIPSTKSEFAKEEKSFYRAISLDNSNFENFNLSRSSNSDFRPLIPRVHLFVGDITDPDTCVACAKDIDVIVHLAANTGVGPSVQDPRKDMEPNVIGTFNMLEAARLNGVPRFVFASSGAPVGECEPPIHEEMAPHPVSPYGASKLAGEGYCSAYYRTFGLETVALRFGNVYGPGSERKTSLVAKFIKQAIIGETLEIYGDGSQTRDFIYIDDLVSAIYQSATLQPNHIAGEIFQIATHSETTVGELTELLVNRLNIEGVKNVKLVYTEQRKGDVQRNYSDTTKAQTKLGWKAETKLEAGLRNTAEWFFSQMK